MSRCMYVCERIAQSTRVPDGGGGGEADLRQVAKGVECVVAVRARVFCVGVGWGGVGRGMVMSLLLNRGDALYGQEDVVF